MNHDRQRWRADWERDGYLVVPDLLDSAQLASLRKAIEKITADPDALPPNRRRFLSMETDALRTEPQYNDLTAEQVGKAIKNVMELPLFDPLFGELICHGPLLDVLEILFDSTEFAFHNYKAIIKAPRVSSAFRWHRDLPYVYHTGADIITAMLCLDEMTEANGATVVLPGSHRVAVEQIPVSDKHIPEEKVPVDFPRVAVTCPAGAAVLFHASIIHGGPANRSDHPRRNLISIWTGPDTYPILADRFAYQGLMPRSKDPARQRQVRMAFPQLFR
jgi:ectoine hydroxylase-related dioxygenase (phytanoyl-CoA dioxygenase family)